ncbi:hypothetical protein BBP40_008821 [Aspergillus hancockii]|nr:hypothetical protein BBP40_008821 [Aspergillus hancockii]
MFSTFSADFDTSRQRSVTPGRAPRPKRSQVARACDWCRLNRIKCDDKQPCRNCQNRGGFCSNTKPLEATSLPAANRELQRLRSKTKDLEEQIRRLKNDAENRAQVQAQAQAPAEYATPPLSDAISSSSSTELSNTNEGWQGFQQPNARAGALYYGPMSSSYFVDRITRYLSEAPNPPLLDTKLEACVARFNYNPPSRRPSRSDANPATRDNHPGGVDAADDLSRFQEEYFLNLLWQSFHCVYPILSEPEFRRYYDSLWPNSRPDGVSTRKPSPLIDVLLAVCMQYGSTFLINDDESRGGNNAALPAENANMAGHAFYQRAQRLLQSELENPSVMLLQSHIYSIIYLYNASLLNTAHINLGMTLRMAHALRLHLRPLDGTPPEEQELHRRIWWTLYLLDSQLSMTSGRPPLIQMSHVSCGLPGDGQEHSRLSNTMLLSSHEDITWLSFHVQCTKLIFATQVVQTAFQKKCSQLLNGDKVKDIYDDPRTTEILAQFLGREMTAVHDWVQNVPRSLRNARKGAGEAFSTERTPLDLSPYSPLWLQRQRLLLELFYHHLQVSTLRPFLRFPPVAVSLTPLADDHSISCLNHSMTITSILNQVLFETDLLRGWPSIFQHQWDAILCTLGFVLANPVCPPTPSARKSLQTAIRTLELVGDQHFPAAKTAAQVVCEVSCRADRLIDNFRQSLTRRPRQQSNQCAPSTLSLGCSATQTPSSSSSQNSSGPTLSRSVKPLEAISSLELNLSSAGSSTGLTPPIGRTELRQAVPPSAISEDIFAGNETQWLHDNGMIIDSWTDFTTDSG